MPKNNICLARLKLYISYLCKDIEFSIIKNIVLQEVIFSCKKIIVLQELEFVLQEKSFFARIVKVKSCKYHNLASSWLCCASTCKFLAKTCKFFQDGFTWVMTQ